MTEMANDSAFVPTGKRNEANVAQLRAILDIEAAFALIISTGILRGYLWSNIIDDCRKLAVSSKKEFEEI